MAMLKKSYLSSAYNGVQQCYCTCSLQPVCKSSTSPSNVPAPRARSQQHNPNKRRKTIEQPFWITKRSYATARGDSKDGMDFRDNMNWPRRRSDNPNPFVPSPYEIFDIAKGASYGRHIKLKYFELVKIYHPDRNGISAGCESLSHGERLERYRLIVLAHEILSDPEKRRAYDAYGAGWGSKQQHAATRQSRGFSSTTGKQYGQGPGYDNSPFANATWEDWERWYRRNAEGPQKQAYAGTYVSPNAFAAFVIMLAIVSGIFQATRASTLSGNMAEKQLAFTEETTRFMTARASQFEDEKLDSDGRVKAFLQKRDPTRYGLKEEEEEQYRKHFAQGIDLPPIGRSRSPKDGTTVDG